MSRIYLFLYLLFKFVSCETFIYHLNESEYSRMPPLFHLDEYDGCLREEGGVYCNVKFHIVTDQPTPLYDLMTQYSAHRWTHYNHTLAEYGICLTKSCKGFYQQKVTADPSAILEACLNSSLWTKHELKSRVQNVKCERANEQTEWDNVDTVVALSVASLLMLNIVGCLREICFKNYNKLGESFMGCFSIGRNWRKLTSPADSGPDPRFARLIGLNGLRVLLTVLVIIAHTCIPLTNHSDNPHEMEEWYYSKTFNNFTNGAIAIQFFITLSAFLLSYYTMVYKESHKITWRLLPTAVINRLMRLIPVYAFMLAIIATLLRHFKSGPLWQSLLGDEIEHCRRDWWLHLLFINNYSRHYNASQCMLNSWYIALDVQLHIVALIVFTMMKDRYRMKVLMTLFMTGMMTTAAHTYYQDLDVSAIFYLEGIRTYFMYDQTFKYVYTRLYTNLSSYTVGLISGLYVYHWQKTDYQFNRYMKTGFFIWLMVPGTMFILHINSRFYLDRPPAPLYLRAVYAAIIKPIAAVILILGIISLIFQFENQLRRFFEAKVWTVPARVSYGMAVNNILVLKLSSVYSNSLLHLTALRYCMMAFSNVMLSFMLAVALHLMVDLPCQNLIKLFSHNKTTNKNILSDGNNKKVNKQE